MTYGEKIQAEYFDWMYDMMCHEKYTEPFSYRKLLAYLHDTEFIYSIPRDENRWDDGYNLRRRFALEHENKAADDYIHGPCTVLEMMVALAIRCEETIMDDPNKGDRTSQWFWNMIVNLGLSTMTDNRYDERLVEDVVRRFLYRRYGPDGKGGLFTVKNCDRDLRTVEIWHQMCWHLNDILG